MYNVHLWYVHLWSQHDVALWPRSQIYRFFNMFSCPSLNYFLIWHWLTIFGTCVSHHEWMCCVDSWSRFDIDLWPQDQIYRVHDMVLIWLWYGFVPEPELFCPLTLCLARECYHGTICHVHSWPLYHLDFDLNIKIYIFTMNLSLTRSSLLFDIGIPNFCTWVYHHETCCVHSGPLCDLDLWSIRE